MKLANRVKVLNTVIIASAIAIGGLLIGLILFYTGSTGVACFAPGRITVFEVRENYDLGDLKAEISRPMVSGFSDRGFENRLNAKIKNQIYLNMHVAEMGTQQWFDSKYELSYSFRSDYWVKSSQSILSLKVTTIFWHYSCGDPRLTSYYNVDIANNEMLTLGKLFIDSSYKQKINKIITDVMIAQEYDSPDLFKGVSDNTKFFIMDGKLYIAFSAYEIASGSEGEPEFLIPTEEIKDLLKPEYNGIFK